MGLTQALMAFGPIRKLHYRLRFPGLRISQSALVYVTGRFRYGPGCSIDRGARILVSEKSSLFLEEGCRIDSDVEIQPDPGHISIGKGTSIQKRCSLLGEVAIGRMCLFAPNVFVSSGTHQYAMRPNLLIRDQDDLVAGDESLYRKENAQRVTIEEDCWIGVNVVIMKGVTVGKGCVVGANSVVTGDLPPYSIAVGAPARVKGHRLEFVPPRRISASNEKDFPYFYRGFDQRHRHLPGPTDAEPCLEILGDFAVWLEDGQPGTTNLILEFGIIQAEGMVLVLGDCVQPITPAQVKYAFPAPSVPSGRPQSFTLQGLKADSPSGQGSGLWLKSAHFE